MASTQKSVPAQRNEFVAIAATLQQRIQTGEVGVGRFLPTERELQEEFSVSRSTIRRALKRLEDDGWARKVPNRGAMAASGFAKTDTMNIALIDGGTYVLRVLMHRFSSRLRQAGYHLVHLGGSGNIAMEDPLQYAVENDFAGALVWPYRGFTDEDLVARLTASMPVVSLDHRLRGGRADLVTFDYESAAEEATSHLIRQGCRRIAVAGMMDMLEANHQRLSGFMKAMFASGQQPQVTDYLFTMTSGMSVADTRNLERRLRDVDRPDGIFVFQDEHVPAVVEAVQQCGLRIPDDVKLVTIGDEVEVNVEGRGLTAVALDWDTMARTAVDLLFDRIDNPTRDNKKVTAQHCLIVRGLCGAPRSEWTPDPDAVTGFHGDLPFPRSQYQYSSSWPARKAGPEYGLQ